MAGVAERGSAVIDSSDARPVVPEFGTRQEKLLWEIVQGQREVAMLLSKLVGSIDDLLEELRKSKRRS